MTAATLCFEDLVVARCENGAFRAELALFFPAAPVGSKAPPTIFPLVTTAGQARSRLEAVGIGRALIHDARAALRPEVIASYARGPSVRRVGAKLGLPELFAGGVYDPESQTYDGQWLNMRAMAGAIGVRGAGYALQVIHLAALLGELRPEVPVTLIVGDVAPPSSRRLVPLRFPEARRLPLALVSLQPLPAAARGSEAPPDDRDELVSYVRHRRFGRVTEAAADRLLLVEQELARVDLPTEGLLASLDAWTLHLQLEASDGRKLDEQLAALERRQGESPATRYLREYASFVRGLEPARKVAERLSKLPRSTPPLPEVDLLEARVWLAAGMPGYARRRAQSIVEMPDLRETLRAKALSILEAAPSGGHGSSRPPTDVGTSPIIVVGEGEAGIVVEAPAPLSPPEALPGPGDPARRYSSPPAAGDRTAYGTRPSPQALEAMPAGARMTPIPPSPVEFDRGLVTVPPPPAVSSTALAAYVPMRPRAVSIPEPVPVARPSGAPSWAPPAHGTLWKEYEEPPPPARGSLSRPPSRAPAPSWSEAPPGGSRGSRSSYIKPENLETLALPDGAHEELLNPGATPRTPLEVRIACTRMARELGRDYRVRYGVKLRTDAIAVETLQRHLLTMWPDGKLDGPDALKELRRHGALLSEVLARTLNATWVDVTPSEIGYWAMFVPPATRTWPFGRVYRFVTMRQKGRDLVSYYLELRDRARRASDEG